MERPVPLTPRAQSQSRPVPLPFTPIPIPAGGLTGPRPTGY